MKIETPTTALHQGGDDRVSALHPDIIQSHILSLLDGASLSSLASASSQLHAISTQENLWRTVCASAWPSINHPCVREIISAFPSGHRSFFSDAFPFPDVPWPSKHDAVDSFIFPTGLISAVDVFYESQIIYSKVEETETSSNWFLGSPFRVDLFDPKDSAPAPIKHLGVSKDETWLKNLEVNLSLSWIVIDPSRKKAVNMSSRRAVSVQRHWLTGDVQVRFGMVMAGDQRRGSSKELVECGVTVTCGGKEGGETHVREVSLVMEDLDGKGLKGKDCLVILESMMESGKRRNMKGKYEEFEERKMERKERKEKKERTLDLICMTIGVAGFVTFWSVMLFR